MRLLGLLFDHKLDWWPLIHDLADRANAKVWTLVKLRYAGASVHQLLENYTLKIRSILECASEVFGCVISSVQSKVLEE